MGNLNKSGNQSGFLTVLLILLAFVTITGISFFYISQNNAKKDNSTLNTNFVVEKLNEKQQDVVTVELVDYKNSDFEFKYPLNMHIEKSDAGDYENELFYLQTSGYKPFTAGSYQIEVHVLKGKNNLSPNQYQSNIVSNIPEYDFLKEIKSTSINGIPVIVKTYKSSNTNGSEAGWGLYKVYYFYSPEVSINFKATGSSSNHEILDNLAASFKFIK